MQWNIIPCIDKFSFQVIQISNSVKTSFNFVFEEKPHILYKI
jgi:hypothetical protein